MKNGLTRCFWALLSLMITLIIICGIGYTYLEFQLPNVAILKDAHMQAPLRIYTADGQLIAQYGPIRRMPVSLNDIPPLLVKAVVATEDARYYEHPGVDFTGILRAAVAVIHNSGRKVQGASTITMQVARNFFLSRKKTYGRKIKEILLALKIDKVLSKNKVLELYLNKVYFGKQAYGVAAAAKVYYGESLSDLTLPQIAMIAGLPQSPSRNNPINKPAQALKRRNHVLSRMLTVGYLTQAQYDQAIKAPITASFHGKQIAVQAPYFAEMVRQVVVSDFGNDAYTDGLSVYTTLAPQKQQAAIRALQNGLIAYNNRHGYRHPTQNLGNPTTSNITTWEKTLISLGNPAHLIPAAVIQNSDNSMSVLLADGETITIPWQGLSWASPALDDGYAGMPPKNAAQIANPGDVVWVTRKSNGQWALTQLPSVQGAIVSMDPNTGAIEALSGGFDYSTSNFNRATQAMRQPGSGFKPFIYAAALDKGYTLASTINDAPIVMQDSGENELWRPHNDTNLFYGPTRLKVGLAKSRNLVSIRLLQAIGIDYTLDYVKRFGFNPARLPDTLSLALGSGTVTPLEVATGYATFANGGYRITPYFINKITKGAGNIIYQANPKTVCDDNCSNAAPRVLNPQIAYLMNDALQSVVQTGTGRAALSLGRQDLAGKTGTTNKQIDAWFSGFNGKLLTVVWVGYDDLTSLHEYGSRAALPIWINYMRSALRDVPESTMAQPSDIITARIDSDTGLLAPPGDNHIVFEQFRKENVPTQYAQITTTPTKMTNNTTPQNTGNPLF